MKISNLQKETELMIAESLINEFSSKRYVDWAVKLLNNGYESEYLNVLAGLDNEESETVDKYFKQVLFDLKIEVESDKEKLIEIYATYIAEGVVKKEITTENGLPAFVKVANFMDYESKYLEFTYLSDDIYGLENGEYSYYHDGLTLENKEGYIIEEFGLFLEAEKLENPDSAKEFVYCEKCTHVGKSILKKTLFNRNGTLRCEKCGSKNIKSYWNQKGKRGIVEYLTKKQ